MNFTSCFDENYRPDLCRSYREGRVSLSTSLLLCSLPPSIRHCLLLFLSFLFNFPYFLFFSFFLFFFLFDFFSLHLTHSSKGAIQPSVMCHLLHHMAIMSCVLLLWCHVAPLHVSLDMRYLKKCEIPIVSESDEIRLCN